jgi:PAS domain S-box-containing protein
MSVALSETPGVRVDHLASNARAIPMSCYVPLRLVCFALFVWAAGAHAAFSASRQVVVLYDERTDLPGLSVLDASLVNTLIAGSPEPIDVYRESMDLSRFDSAAYRALLRDYLRTKYSGKKIDVVVSVLGPSLRFLLSEGDPIFPGAPIVFCGLDRRELGGQQLPSNVTGVLLKREFLSTLELALRLHPDTKRVVFVAGTSEFDSRLVEQAKQEFRAVEDRVEIAYLTKLPLNKLLTELSQLPPHSIILYSTLFRDGSGEAFVPHDIAKRISATANAPVYGFLDQYLGLGIVGGNLYSLERVGEETARLTLQILAGVQPSALPPLEPRISKMMFDARQLQRWGISESQLPPEAVVMFRTRSFSTLWDEYRTFVTEVLVIVALLALLIVALLVERFWRHRAEAKVRESEARYRAVVEDQTELICRFLPDGTYTFVNSAYCRYFQRSPEELLGRSFWTFIPPEEHQALRDSLASITLDHSVATLEHEVLAPGGELRWQQWSDRGLFDARGHVVEYQAVGRDITERKRAQAEAEERRTEVTHLTRVAILGELSGALAHELNQPLTAILSNAQAAERLLAKTPVDLDEVREILSDISNDDKRAGDVISRLRVLMRKGKANLVLLNLNDLANDVLQLAHSELVERNVAVTTRLMPGLPDIRGDRVQLQQVLLNLIMNACEAMSDTDSRDRSLVVSTAHDDDSNLHLTVADRGPGISSDLVDRIFKPFVTTKAQGLGLGLSICRSIVVAHGGRLWAANNSDRGASFFVSLPIHAGGHA